MTWNIGTASRVEVTMICDSTMDTLYMDPPGVSVRRLGLGHAFDPAKGLTKMPVADNCSCMLIRIYALEGNTIGAPVPYTILFDCGGTPDSFMFKKAARQEDVAKAGIRALRLGKVLCFQGVFTKWMSFLCRLVPRSTARKFAKKMNSK